MKDGKTNVDVGLESVVIGQVSGKVGDRSVVIGAMDDRGNIRLDRPMAVGSSAFAGAGSIAIGANATAGAELPFVLNSIGHLIRESGDRRLQVTYDNLIVELGSDERRRGSIRALWTIVETSATLSGGIDLVRRASDLLRGAGFI